EARAVVEVELLREEEGEDHAGDERAVLDDLLGQFAEQVAPEAGEVVEVGLALVVEALEPAEFLQDGLAFFAGQRAPAAGVDVRQSAGLDLFGVAGEAGVEDVLAPARFLAGDEDHPRGEDE